MKGRISMTVISVSVYYWEIPKLSVVKKNGPVMGDNHCSFQASLAASCLSENAGSLVCTAA